MEGAGEGAVWPLAGVEAQLLDALAHLIARGGAWRFLHGPVLAPDEDAYPDPWDQSRDALGRVLARTLWHARLDLEVRLEDVRAPGRASDRDLRTTRLELVSVDDRGASFTVSEIGNDDVAGLCAHRIGRVLVARLEDGGAPFRAAGRGDERLPGEAIGSVAALYAGLGVIATNAARYDRSAGRTVGNLARHEFQIASAGGLDSRHLAFLLAVQATVRDDVLPALDALHPTQAADVAAWRDVLDDHEDELALRLGLRGADDAPPPRSDAPRAAVVTARFAERDLTTFNLGKRVWAVRRHRGTTLAIPGIVLMPGILAGAFALAHAPRAAIALAAISGMIVGPIVGWMIGRRFSEHYCSGCRRSLDMRREACRFCGGKVAGEVLNEIDRLDRDDERDALEAGDT
jgi:hypothetical protein